MISSVPRAERLVAAQAGQRFQSAVPADDPSFDIFDNDTDVDRFNDVLAEILQALIFGRLLLQRTVQPRVLERNTDVIRHRFQQVEVFSSSDNRRSGSPQSRCTRSLDL